MSYLKPGKTEKSFGYVLVFLFFIVLFLLPAPVFSTDVVSLAKSLESNLPAEGEEYYEENKEWIEEFREAVKFLTNYENTLSPLKLSIGAGYYGHKAGESSLYKLSIDAGVNYNTFPNSFRFKTGTSIQFKDNTLQENVTTLQMSYDHHFAPWFELYGFIERFSDSFLSIHQRYEIGGGFKVEFDILKASREKELADYKKKSIHSFKRYKENLGDLGKSKQTITSLSGELDSLNGKADLIKQAIQQEYAVLSAGICLSFFSELEHAEIETLVEEEKDGTIQEVSNKFLLDAEHRFRIVLRPSLEFRPIDDLIFKGLIYFKFPLSRPYRVNDELDLRMDSFFSIEYKLSNSSDWLKNVSLTFEYQRHSDKAPPELPQSILDEYTIVGDPVARAAHDEFSFKLNVQF